MAMCLTLILPNIVLSLWLNVFLVSDKNLECWNIFMFKLGISWRVLLTLGQFCFYLKANPTGGLLFMCVCFKNLSGKSYTGVSFVRHSLVPQSGLYFCSSIFSIILTIFNWLKKKFFFTWNQVSSFFHFTSLKCCLRKRGKGECSWGRVLVFRCKTAQDIFSLSPLMGEKKTLKKWIQLKIA